MKRRSVYHGLVGIAALLLWIGSMIVVIAGGDKRSWILYYIVPGSVITFVVTARLCRFWSARHKRASFGTMIGVPFCSVILVWLGLICLDGAWAELTPDYWRHSRDTFTHELVRLAVIASYCVLPAISVVIYHHIKDKEHDHVA
jgi:hypothetical protein